jgi:glucokinase
VSTAKDVVIAANSGEADALGIVRTAADALGATIGGLINVLDPEAVIVGGGLGLSEGVYWNGLKEATRRHIWSHVNRSIPIQRAATGSNAGVLGAALAAWQREK